MPQTPSARSAPRPSAQRVIAGIARNLRTLRLRAEMSQHSAAQALNVSYQQIQKYENGRNRVTAEKIYTLRKLYDVPYSAFFEGLPEDE
jgi:transcriptional regulator with XRE-family HTH domain